MSGVYLTVWDPENRENSPILKPTRGGWPHITLAYSGKHLDQSRLVQIAAKALTAWAGTNILLETAYVNSFKLDSGEMRHDVLLRVADAHRIQLAREEYFGGLRERDQLHMGEPHVTHGIYTTRAEAEAVAAALNANHLPRRIVVDGVTI